MTLKFCDLLIPTMKSQLIYYFLLSHFKNHDEWLDRMATCGVRRRGMAWNGNVGLELSMMIGS